MNKKKGIVKKTISPSTECVNINSIAEDGRKINSVFEYFLD